jgi:DNA-binding MurR/RpiR family transcriptional regulator
VPVDRPQDGTFSERLARRGSALSAAERRVADFLLEKGFDVLLLSAVELGRLTRTSDATVVRTAKRLGYSGLPALKRELGAQQVEQTHPARRLVARYSRAGSTSSGALDSVVSDAAERLEDLRELHDEAAVLRLVEVIESAGRVHAFGVGLSRVAAEYFTLRVGRLGLRAHVMSGMGFALADDLLSVEAGDAVVLFAPGRMLREISVLLDHARDVGATSALVTDSLQGDPRVEADIVVRAPDSLSGFTGEALTSMLIVDMLVLTLGHRSEERARHTSHLLNRLRKGLMPELRSKREDQ